MFYTTHGVKTVRILSLEAKKAYFAKTRRSNYMASLRLEGFRTQPEDATLQMPSREVLLSRYRKVKT